VPDQLLLLVSNLRPKDAKIDVISCIYAEIQVLLHTHIWLYICIAGLFTNLADFRLGDTSGNTLIALSTSRTEITIQSQIEGACRLPSAFLGAVDGQENWEDRTGKG
jgi:hypothetical protein